MSSERKIFKYNRGDKEYHFDPLECYMRIIEECVASNINIDQLSTITQPSSTDIAELHKFVDGLRKLVNICCAAFGITKFSEQNQNGWTNNEILDLWRAFWEYTAGVKKNTDSTPSQPSSTEESATSAAQTAST